MEDTDVLPPGLESINADASDPISEVAENKNEEEKEEETVENNEEVEDEEEDNPFADDDDSDEEGGAVQVTIRKVEPVIKTHSTQGKLDIDNAPILNDKTIYDIDLATMEDRPWRKPGADITDYFNYGFTEDTWNIYCERQKKLRSEFGNNQQKANQALFNNIQLINPLANPIIMPPSGSVVKVLTDNGGRFKPASYPMPQNNLNNDAPIMRTVIGAPQTQQAPVIDFSRPPPGMSMPPPNMSGLSNPSDAPPGIESDRPPGVLSPPPGGGLPPGASSMPASLDLNLGMPPPVVGAFNPALPPPMGLMGPPIQSYGMAPFSRAGFGTGPIGSNRPSYNDDDDRRRKRSRSPSKKESSSSSSSSRRRERERESSRRHRSRSRSGDRKSSRHREDRDRKRDRRDDDERSSKKSRSRRDDDDDDRRERKEKSSRSRHNDDENDSKDDSREDLNDQ